MCANTLYPDLISISVHFRKPYFFPEDQVNDFVIKAGFTVPDEGAKVLEVLPNGTQAPSSRWTKGTVEVFYSGARSMLTFRGDKIQGVATAFSDVLKLVESNLSKELPKELEWTEIQLDGRATSDYLPMQILSDLGDESIKKELGAIFNLELRNFSIRLFSTDSTALDNPINKIVDWFDLTIEPFIPNPSYFHIRLVYRLHDSKKAVAFALTSEKTIMDALGVMENRGK